MSLNSKVKELWCSDDPYPWERRGYGRIRTFVAKLALVAEQYVCEQPTLVRYCFAGACPTWGIFKSSAIARLTWYHVTGFTGRLLQRLEGFATYDWYDVYYETFSHMDIWGEGKDWDDDLDLVPRWLSRYWLGE